MSYTWQLTIIALLSLVVAEFWWWIYGGKTLKGWKTVNLALFKACVGKD